VTTAFRKLPPEWFWDKADHLYYRRRMRNPCETLEVAAARREGLTFAVAWNKNALGNPRPVITSRKRWTGIADPKLAVNRGSKQGNSVHNTSRLRHWKRSTLDKDNLMDRVLWSSYVGNV